MKIALESLGCSKNLVDAEVMLGMLNKQGHQLVGDCEDSDIVIVNTCGFIEDAKQESIDSIVRYAEMKNEGIIKYLLVSGCLAQRYPDELLESIPEIDAIVGTGSYDKITDIVDGLDPDSKIVEMGDINSSYDPNLPRYISTPPHLAYLKIGEGCDNKCTYCIIPKLRGRYRSRSVEELLTEAKKIKESGVKELVVIAQDTTAYGIDLYDEPMLAKLLEELAKLDFDWIRVLYSYPEGIDENLLDVIAKYPNICSYFDIPMQHASDKILKLMNRKTTKEELKSKIELIRSKVKDAVIRTTFIVGFPGETEEDYNELVDFVSEMKFDRMGAFKYSREENTPADKLPNHIDEDVKKERLDRLMMLQQTISEEVNKKNQDRVLKVLVEDQISPNLYVGRSQYDAEDIDSVVYIETEEDIEIGEMVDVKIDVVYEYDLKGHLL